MPKGSNNDEKEGRPNREKIAFVSGWISHEVQSFAQGMGIPQQLLAAGVAEFLYPEGVGMFSVLPRTRMQKSLPAKGTESQPEREMGEGAHNDETRSVPSGGGVLKDRIVNELKKKALGRHDLAHKLKATPSAISYHLTNLTKEGVLKKLPRELDKPQTWAYTLLRKE